MSAIKYKLRLKLCQFIAYFLLLKKEAFEKPKHNLETA